MIRLFRLIRISKVFKSISSENENDPNSTRKKSKKDSKVGRRLSELATKRVILTCFMLLLLLPLFEANFWLRAPEAIGAACLQFKVMIAHSYATTQNLDTSVYSKSNTNDDQVDQLQNINFYTSELFKEFNSNGPGSILQIDFPNTQGTFYLDTDYSEFRKEEMLREACTLSGEDLIIFQDNLKAVRLGAIINIVRTFYVSFLLLGGSLLFGRDIYTLVINPIERMIEKVTEVIERPQKTKEKAFILQEEEEMKVL